MAAPPKPPPVILALVALAETATRILDRGAEPVVDMRVLFLGRLVARLARYGPLVLRRFRASAIWLATVRFQIKSYSASWSLERKAEMSSGLLNTEVGRTASWASWAFFLLVNTRGLSIA